MSRHRHIAQVLAPVAAFLLIFWLVSSLGQSGLGAAGMSGPHPRAAAPSARPGAMQPVAPATTVAPDTPTQQQVDQGLAGGLTSGPNLAMFQAADALAMPAAAIVGGWPILTVSDTPEEWVRQFVAGLLDIDFARESRGALAAWLMAEEAPDLMPGIPSAFAHRALLVSLLYPSITQQVSPVPDAATWQADAAAGVVWSLGGLTVQPDPGWQSIIDEGWQPRDVRTDVEDVSGTLTIRQGSAASSQRFAMVVQVGSAAWHDGYGTVLVSDWRES